MEVFDHYPLVKKALGEQKAIFERFGESVPEDLLRATLRTLETLDVCLQDAPFEYRQDLMAASVLMNCPSYLFLRSGQRLVSDYSAHVQDMLAIHISGDGITEKNDDVLQIYSALFIAHSQNLFHLLNSTTTADPHWLADVRESLDNYVDDRKLLEHKITPSLRALENQMIVTLFEAIDKLSFPTQRQKPPPGKNKGPSP